MKKLIAIVVILSIFESVNGQIRLTKDFKLVKPVGESFREYFYSNGRINFHHDINNQESLTENQIIEIAKENGSKDLMLETKDKLIIYTGKSENGKYYYNILIASENAFLSCTSYNNNKEFANSSIWLLKKVRELKRKNNIDFYFTN